MSRPLARAWAYRLFLAQLVNGVLLLIGAIGALPDAWLAAFPWLAAWKAHALLIHASAVPAIAGVQLWIRQLLKTLPDRDGDGRADIIDEAPDDPARPGTGGGAP